MAEIIVEFPSPLTEREQRMIYGYKGEIVRCKDCKYFREGSPIIPYMYQCWRTTFYGNPVIYTTTPDDFCSRGERREA